MHGFTSNVYNICLAKQWIYDLFVRYLI